MTDTRRSALTLIALAPIALLGVRRLGATEPSVCYDPNALPLSQKSRRRSLGYVEQSPDSVRHCSACSFFSTTAPTCGRCALLGGAVNAGAVCTSFAAKASK